MSYRDLRNFTEMMKALGYSRLISMENFRNPNFSLVAEILIWLSNRFESDAEIHTSYETEEDRVLLIRSVAQFMALKANIILNTKRLYQADGYAVKEIMKITSLLFDALKVNSGSRKETKSSLTSQELADISSRIQDLKLSRELASQVTKKGASLYQLLGKEVELREARNSSVSHQIELNTIENGLQKALETTRETIASTKSLIENVAVTESSLDSKIDKRLGELERNQKRLQTLKKVRPGFLEEFEKLEVELQALYEEYVTKARIVAHLEMQQEEAQAAQQERILKRQKETRKLMEEIQMEDARKLMEDDLEEEQLEEEEAKTEKINGATNGSGATRRLRTATAARGRLGTGKKRVFGGMTAEDDDDSASLDSDSDLLVDYDDQDDDEDDDENSDLMPNEKRQHEQLTSDDDF